MVKTIDLSNMTTQETMPWIEKYRPSSLDDVISQNNIVNTLKKFIKNKKLPHMLFYGPPGVGKCLGKDTPIIMYDGSIKKVQNIMPNDILMGDDNTPRTVLNTVTGTDCMYKINQSVGNSYIVNSEHIISLKLVKQFIEIWSNQEKKYYLYWFENGQIKQKSIQVCNKYLTTKLDAKTEIDNFKNILLQNNIADNKNTICDIKITEYIQKCNIWKSAYKGYKADIITCWQKINVDHDPYIFGYNVHNNQIPREYLVNNIESRAQLLAGFLDSHGYVSCDNKFVFSTKSKEIYDNITFLAGSLGLIAVNKTFVSDNSDNLYYEGVIYGFGSGSVNIPTKIHKIDPKNYKIYKDLLTTDITVEKLNNDVYYGFEIDGNKRFLLEDFTVTHNTSVITACARELYGDKYEMMVIEINASEERGIEVVRNRITNFATKRSISFDETPTDLFKLVILDEADAMTLDAQASLRRVIEKYTYNVRFCLICNYIKKINMAVQSRCIPFRFAPLKEEYIREKMELVIAAEDIDITESGISTIIKRSKGDMRKVLNILQTTSMAYDKINGEIVNECLGYPSYKCIYDLVTTFINKSFVDSYKLLKNYKDVKGFAINDILCEIHDMLITHVLKPDKKIIIPLSVDQIRKIIEQMRELEHNITNSTSDNIHLGELIGAFKITTLPAK